MPTALLFPGQGAQRVGMDAGLDRRTFEEADDALGFSLSRIIREGPEERLAETEITQPAIVTVSVAMWRMLASRRPDLAVVAAAGHSLGEYAALTAAGGLAFADAVRLVHLRGRVMQAAVPLGVGTMGAILGLEASDVELLCSDAAADEVVEVAGVNCPGQVVVAGHAGAVARVIAGAEARGGAGRTLAVSAPFHCSLLGPAADALREALKSVAIAPLAFPVVHNADGAVAPDAAGVRARLVEQVVRPVRWTDCVRTLVSLGSSSCVELGPGKTLAALVKRIDRSLPVRTFTETMG